MTVVRRIGWQQFGWGETDYRYNLEISNEEEVTVEFPAPGRDRKRLAYVRVPKAVAAQLGSALVLASAAKRGKKIKLKIDEHSSA